VFTVGFCFGGSNSLERRRIGHGLSGAIGFYGRPAGSRNVAEIASSDPGADGRRRRGDPREDVEAFDRALTGAGVEHDVKIYDGAPHSFFDRKHEEFANASTDA